MTSILFVLFFAVACAVLNIVLKNFSPNFSMLLAGAAGIIFLIVFMEYATPVFEYLSGIYTGTGFENYFTLLIKALGISFLVCTVTGILNDLGETSIANNAETCGKAALLWLALPIIKKLFEYVGETVP